jgi:predicted transcriptional regulator
MRGEKKFEFRRSIFARPVDIVLVYATVPIRQVVAEFDVCSVISETLPLLWKQTHQFAGIDEEFFWKYFEGRDCGHAIEIGDVRPYKIPFCPIEKLGVRPPQSFVYLE